MGLISLKTANEMDYEEFTSVFGNVVEHCSIFAAGIWVKRPFQSLKHLHTTFSQFMDTLPELGKYNI